MMWGKKRTPGVQIDSLVKAKNRKRVIALASGIGLGVGTVILGIITIWLLSMQALLNGIAP